MLSSRSHEIRSTGSEKPSLAGRRLLFWYPPDKHPYGELQVLARTSSRKSPGSAQAFVAAYTHPELAPVAEARRQASAEEFAAEESAFALAHEAVRVGIAPMDPLYVFEGYTIDEPWVIVLALAPIMSD